MPSSSTSAASSGAKEVAIGFEKLKFMTDKNGNKYLYINFIKGQLTAQTAYDKGTYAQTWDKKRLIVKKSLADQEPATLEMRAASIRSQRLANFR